MRPSTQARLVSVGLNRSESGGSSSSVPSSGEPQSESPNPPPLHIVVMVVDGNDAGCPVVAHLNAKLSGQNPLTPS